jgi:hypothetical protein
MTKTLIIHNATNPGASVNVLWDPGPGIRFQLVKLIISTNGILAGATIINLLDGADNLNVSLSMTPGSSNSTQVIQIDFPGDGIISSTDGNQLKTYVSVAMTSGTIIFTSFGYEI